MPEGSGPGTKQPPEGATRRETADSIEFSLCRRPTKQVGEVLQLGHVEFFLSFQKIGVADAVMKGYVLGARHKLQVLKSVVLAIKVLVMHNIARGNGAVRSFPNHNVFGPIPIANPHKPVAATVDNVRLSFTRHVGGDPSAAAASGAKS